MTKPLSPVTTIPNEFNLSAYDICRTWKLEDWAVALSTRMLLYRHWRLACLEGEDDETPEKMILDVRDMAQKMLQNPLETVSISSVSMDSLSRIRDQSVSEFFEGYYVVADCDSDNSNEKSYKKWVECLHLSEIPVEDEGNVWVNGQEDRSLTESIRAANHILEGTAAWKMHREYLEYQKPFFIAVDLGVSNERLMKDFKDWLKKTRAAVGVAPKIGLFDETDFLRWHEQRLLPFLDLTFWAATRGKRIQQFVMGCRLFPDDLEKSPESRVRKTVAPNALEIVSEEVVSALIAQSRSSHDTKRKNSTPTC